MNTVFISMFTWIGPVRSWSERTGPGEVERPEQRMVHEGINEVLRTRGTTRSQYAPDCGWKSGNTTDKGDRRGSSVGLFEEVEKVQRRIYSGRVRVGLTGLLLKIVDEETGLGTYRLDPVSL